MCCNQLIDTSDCPGFSLSTVVCLITADLFPSMQLPFSCSFTASIHLILVAAETPQIQFHFYTFSVFCTLFAFTCYTTSLSDFPCEELVAFLGILELVLLVMTGVEISRHLSIWQQSETDKCKAFFLLLRSSSLFEFNQMDAFHFNVIYCPFGCRPTW